MEYVHAHLPRPARATKPPSSATLASMLGATTPAKRYATIDIEPHVESVMRHVSCAHRSCVASSHTVGLIYLLLSRRAVPGQVKSMKSSLKSTLIVAALMSI